MPSRYETGVITPAAASAHIEENNGDGVGPRPFSNATVTIAMVAAVLAVSFMSVLTSLI